MEERGGVSNRGLPLRCFLALFVDVLDVWVTNTYLYPQYTVVLPMARDLSSVAGVVTLIALALWVQHRLPSLREPAFSAVALALVPAGFALIVFGLWQASPVLLGVGAIVRAVGSRWIVMLVGLSLCHLKPRDCMLCIAAAFAASYVARWPLSEAPIEVLFLFLFVEPFAMVLACRTPAAATIELTRETVAPVDASITQPASYIPFSHRFFAAIFTFRIAYGFALVFESVEGVPQQTMLGLVPIGLVALLALKPRLPRADVLYQASALLVAAGFLSVIVLLGRSSGFNFVTNGLLFAGSECFEVLVWFALASIGSRNQANALVVFAWGKAASSAGLLFGATVGHGANALADPLIEAALVAVVLLGFVTANVTVFKGLSFQGTIDGVAATPAGMVVGCVGSTPAGMAGPADAGLVGMAAASLDERCETAARGYRLTPRETEILSLLAHGRNAAYIQEKLVLSRNTVKTDVQNIYAKRGVHSQQELIDVVESFGDEGGA